MSIFRGLFGKSKRDAATDENIDNMHKQIDASTNNVVSSTNNLLDKIASIPLEHGLMWALGNSERRKR